jgi:hypothetical protein
MRPFEFFRDEDHFQSWVTEHLNDFGCHPQPITGDPKYPGIPDLSIGMRGVEVWAELKCWKKEHGCWAVVGDAMKKERELTAQQRDWLRDRSNKGDALCGVLIAWRNKHQTHYVSFIPIDDWKRVVNWNFATLALSPYTETLNRLIACKGTLPSLIMQVISSLPKKG